VIGSGPAPGGHAPPGAPGSTARGLAWTLFGAGGHMLLQLVTLGLLGRLLTPADFGIVAAALVVVNFSVIFAQLGVNQALVQRPTLPPRAAGTSFVLTVALSGALALAVFAAAPTIAAGIGLDGLTPVLRVLAWVFLARALGATAEALLVRSLRFRALAVLDVATYALGYGVVGVTLAVLGFGPWALVHANLVQATSKSALALLLHPHGLRPDLSPAFVRGLVRFGGGVALARVANFVALQADNIVVARSLGAAAVGAYSRAYQLMGMPAGLIGNALDRVLFPTFARQQLAVPVLRAAYLRGSSLIAVSCLPTGVIAWVLAPEIVSLLLGDQWDAVVAPFAVFSLTLVFRVGDRLNAVLARSVGAVYRRAVLQVAYALGVIVLASVGASAGLVGVAVGVAIALVANYALGAGLAVHLVGAHPADALRALARPLPFTALLGGVGLAVTSASRSLGFPPALVLAVGLATCLLASAASLWFAPRFVLGAEAGTLAATARVLTAKHPEAFRRWLARTEGTS
jgi:O-antigen/teichoic acid export membrane protein